MSILETPCKRIVVRLTAIYIHGTRTLDVANRRFLEMTLWEIVNNMEVNATQKSLTNVMCSMLRNITHSKCRMFVYCAFLRNRFSLRNVKKWKCLKITGPTVKSLIRVDFPAPFGPTTPTRLWHSSDHFGALWSEQGVPWQGKRTADVEKTGCTPSRIGKSAIWQFQDCPSVAANSHQRSWGRKRKFDRSRRKRIIWFGLRVLCHEGRKVAWVINQLWAVRQ